MKKLIDYLSSFALMGILLAIFAIGSGVATFIENDYGAATAKVLVYNALWFQVVMALLGINLISVIVKTKMWRRPQAMLLHSSFIVILLGAALTHFVGFEGVMHIRNSQTSDTIVSADTYISISDGSDTVYKKAAFSPIYATPFHESVDLNHSIVSLRLLEYIPNASKSVEADANGSGVVSLMIANQTDAPEQHIIDANRTVESFGLMFGFDSNASVRFAVENDKLFVVSNSAMKVANLADDSTITVNAKEPIELTRGKLYSIGDVRFVPKAVYAKGRVTIVSGGVKGGESALVLELKDTSGLANVTIFGQSGEVGKPVSVRLGDKIYKLAYGAKEIKLPFSLTLDKFELLRYPGSMSPSSYSSYVKVNSNDSSFDYNIYMNHVLDYDGYRFFQSSYDLDEQGTILSVSKDPGKIPTYIGYAMLCLGVLFSFFNPKGRLWTLGRKLIAPSLALFIAFATQTVYAADDNSSLKIDSLFGQIMVQDVGGRIKPMESLAIDVIDKISGESSFDGQGASGILLSMMTYPKAWEGLEIIKVSHPKLKELLDMNQTQKKASFASAFTADGQYKLAGVVEEANRKSPSKRDTFDKDVLKVDERYNVCLMVFTGQFLRVFPKPNDPSNTWLDPQNALTLLASENKEYADKALGALQNLFGGAETDNFEVVQKAYHEIYELQSKYGSAVMPPQEKIEAELFYNKAKIFQRLILVYLFAGLILFVAQIMMNENASKYLAVISKLALGVMTLAFIVQTFALALRWYISGHAPWSDGYESMIYIAWASALAGLIFYRFLPLALAMTGILASAMLLTAHIGFVDPQITNIVPVLKSYWLNIHVSLITASYGFLGLGFFLGLLSLGLFSFRSAAKPERDTLIQKITVVNEMTLIVGLGLLVVGNFLGGIWANESWGRYWGWDPKETWALVSILVYTIVIHYRFIPSLKSVFAFNAMSVFAFASIIMTYFGVNYYLSGLHSYASGDPIPVPWFVWVGIIFVISLFFVAWRKKDLAKI